MPSFLNENTKISLVITSSKSFGRLKGIFLSIVHVKRDKNKGILK